MKRPHRIAEDRSLTNLLIRNGFSTVMEDAARCRTRVPTTYRGVAAMLLRWQRKRLTSPFGQYFSAALAGLPIEEGIDFGCELKAGAFDVPESAEASVETSSGDTTLVTFFMDLLSRLQKLGTVPAIDIGEYARAINPRRGVASPLRCFLLGSCSVGVLEVPVPEGMPSVRLEVHTCCRPALQLRSQHHTAAGRIQAVPSHRAASHRAMRQPVLGHPRSARRRTLDSIPTTTAQHLRRAESAPSRLPAIV